MNFSLFMGFVWLEVLLIDRMVELSDQSDLFVAGSGRLESAVSFL